MNSLWVPRRSRSDAALVIKTVTGLLSVVIFGLVIVSLNPLRETASLLPLYPAQIAPEVSDLRLLENRKWKNQLGGTLLGLSPSQGQPDVDGSLTLRADSMISTDQSKPDSWRGGGNLFATANSAVPPHPRY